ncbi:MAG: histidine kinase [Clostridium sp.]|nr:histidine kinase [Clostridium sp.]
MKNRNFRRAAIGLHIFFAVSLIVFIGYVEKVGRAYVEPKKRMEDIEFIGSCQYSENREEVEIQDGKLPDAKYSPTIILKGHVNREIPKKETVFMYIYRARVDIKQNGKLIYTYGKADSRPKIVKSIGIQWGSFVSSGIKKDDEIEIKIQSVYRTNYQAIYEEFLSSLCFGEESVLLKKQLNINSFKIILSLIIMSLGAIFIVSMVSLYLVETPVPEGSMACGMMMMTGALSTIIDYHYVSLMFENNFLMNIMDNVAQLLVCMSSAYFLKGHLISRRFRVIAEILVSVWWVMSFSYLWVQGNGIVDAPEVIQYYIPIAVAMLGTITVFLIIDYRNYSIKRIRKLLKACVILACSTVIEVVHFWLTDRYLVFIFQIGMLIFTIGQANVIVENIQESLRQVKRMKELEQELIQSRIAVMISQIQPHFLYNTLTGIQELCLSDPDKAHLALSWFAQFLRGNMDSLTTTSLIPFERELHHVKNYLQLENLRYGERLQVVYDIEVNDFKLPALSIQPIVENAVHYGISKKEHGGTIQIQTKESEDGIMITIKDDGVGIRYDTSGKIICYDRKKESHVGIDNVRKRMKGQCNGDVIVDSQPGIGTIVSIKIPRGSI